MAIDARSINAKHGDTTMSNTKTLFAGLAVAILVAASSTGAMAQWKRSGAVTGPHGNTAITEGGGQCDRNLRACTYGGSITGPKGKSFKRSGSASATGQRGVNSSATYTGPRGRTGSRSGSFQLQ
jgi:hypothetical protein